uniref:Uncharacterized protein n=1 Tax=Clandestinovirus TaxID=2831644 RepID=A0A8F8PR11_9VIRU|nr:hypothetical protein KOM_12_371 [Clandestinovirus]
MSVISYLNPFSYFGSTVKNQDSTPVVEQTQDATQTAVEQPKIEQVEATVEEHFGGMIKCDFDDATQEDCSVAVFTLCTPSAVSSFRYPALETEFLKDEWAKIYSDEPSAHLTFWVTNGEVSIKVTPTHTIFAIGSPYGNSEMKVLNEKALPVLRDCHKIWIERKRQAKAGELVDPDQPEAMANTDV